MRQAASHASTETKKTQYTHTWLPSKCTGAPATPVCLFPLPITLADLAISLVKSEAELVESLCSTAQTSRLLVLITHYLPMKILHTSHAQTVLQQSSQLTLVSSHLIASTSSLSKGGLQQHEPSIVFATAFFLSLRRKSRHAGELSAGYSGLVSKTCSDSNTSRMPIFTCRDV